MLLVILTHGALAQAYKEVLGNFIADLSRVEFHAIEEQDNIETIFVELYEKYKTIQEEIIFATDITISSSSNIAYRIAKKLEKSKVVTGINLMLLIQIIECGHINNEIVDLAKNEIKIIKE
ncbi:MAG: hypothetical protein RR500_07025 [Bacilli bacterium]